MYNFWKKKKECVCHHLCVFKLQTIAIYIPTSCTMYSIHTLPSETLALHKAMEIEVLETTNEAVTLDPR